MTHWDWRRELKDLPEGMAFPDLARAEAFISAAEWGQKNPDVFLNPPTKEGSVWVVGIVDFS